MVNGKVIQSRKKRSKLYQAQNRQLWIITALPLIKVFVFSVLPMIWMVMAFQFYKPRYGILYSPFIGMENFMYLFKSVVLFRILRNAVILNVCNILFSTIFNILFALLMFEITNKFFLRFTQSVFYIPYFLSWPIVGIIVSALLDTDGALTTMIFNLTGSKISFYNEPKYWRFIMVVTTVWKGSGVGSIINYCALLGIDKSLFEAAAIDGAGRWRKIFVISLPHIKNMIVVGLISSCAGLIRYDFGQVYFLTNGSTQLYDAIDVVETYIYRAMRKQGDYSVTSAIALFQSTVGFLLAVITNQVTRLISKDDSTVF